jgi:uncharacterized protein (DUF302 family)
MTTGIIIGLFAGIVIGWLIIYLVSPSLLFRESRSFMDMDATVTKIEEQVSEKGWKVPAVHDLQATMKKFGKEVRSVKVLEICHPDHSYQILSRNKERIVSSMMPCRIAVYEKDDGSVWISRMNSGVVARPLTKVVRKTMSAAAKDMEMIISEVLGE